MHKMAEPPVRPEAANWLSGRSSPDAGLHQSREAAVYSGCSSCQLADRLRGPGTENQPWAISNYKLTFLLAGPQTSGQRTAGRGDGLPAANM